MTKKHENSVVETCKDFSFHVTLLPTPRAKDQAADDCDSAITVYVQTENMLRVSFFFSFFLRFILGTTPVVLNIQYCCVYECVCACMTRDREQLSAIEREGEKESERDRRRNTYTESHKKQDTQNTHSHIPHFYVHMHMRCA